jgi:hypothetical protein
MIFDCVPSEALLRSTGNEANGLRPEEGFAGSDARGTGCTVRSVCARARGRICSCGESVGARARHGPHRWGTHGVLRGRLDPEGEGGDRQRHRQRPDLGERVARGRAGAMKRAERRRALEAICMSRDPSLHAADRLRALELLDRLGDEPETAGEAISAEVSAMRCGSPRADRPRIQRSTTSASGCPRCGRVGPPRLTPRDLFRRTRVPSGDDSYLSRRSSPPAV